MFTQRRINEFDNFISNNQQINKIMSPRNQPFGNLTNVRKPMINASPVPSSRLQNNHQINRLKIRPHDLDSNRDHFCSNENHYNKKADYIIHIEDEDMYYCGVCATQAASQGFVVNKIGGVKKQKILPYYPHLTSNKRYQEVQDLMKKIMKLQGQFKRIDPKQTQVSLMQQEGLLNSFYDELVALVENMREDHLCDWKADRQKIDIIYDHMRDNMQNLNQYWQDLYDNIQKIVEGVEARSYEIAMKNYHNEIEMFYQNIEDYEDASHQFKTYQSCELSRRVKNFEHKLIQLWQDDTIDMPTTKKIHQVNSKSTTLPISKNIAAPNTIKNVHQLLPKGQSQTNCEGQSAFRSLFEQDKQQNKIPEKSPQFKAF